MKFRTTWTLYCWVCQALVCWFLSTRLDCIQVVRASLFNDLLLSRSLPSRIFAQSILVNLRWTSWASIVWGWWWSSRQVLLTSKTTKNESLTVGSQCSIWGYRSSSSRESAQLWLTSKDDRPFSLRPKAPRSLAGLRRMRLESRSRLLGLDAKLTPERRARLGLPYKQNHSKSSQSISLLGWWWFGSCASSFLSSAEHAPGRLMICSTQTPLCLRNLKEVDFYPPRASFHPPRPKSSRSSMTSQAKVTFRGSILCGSRSFHIVPHVVPHVVPNGWTQSIHHCCLSHTSAESRWCHGPPALCGTGHNVKSWALISVEQKRAQSSVFIILGIGLRLKPIQWVCSSTCLEGYKDSWRDCKFPAVQSQKSKVSFTVFAILKPSNTGWTQLSVAHLRTHTYRSTPGFSTPPLFPESSGPPTPPTKSRVRSPAWRFKQQQGTTSTALCDSTSLNVASDLSNPSKQTALPLGRSQLP